MSKHDQAALDAATQIIDLFSSPGQWRDTWHLKHKVQCLLIDLLERNATQPAAGEPVEIEAPTFHHVAMACGLEDRGITDRYEAMEYGYNEALEQQWTIINSHGPLFAAPPAAAHGDEAVRKDAARYRWLRDYHIGDDPESINLDRAKRKGLNAAIDAAMRAQGDGGSRDA